MFLLTAFGVKSAIVPLHFWLPGAYTYIPSGVAIFFGAVLTKVGVYSMIRVFGFALNYEHTLFQPIMLTIACLSILIGILGALGQRDLRTILSWDVISQVGFMFLGLSLFTVASLGASIFFMLQYMPTKAGLFVVSGVIERSSGTGNIYRLGGLARIYPWMAGMFLILALSLSGIPPLAGFWAKLGLLQASFGLHSISGYIASVIILLGSILTGFMMMKIWQWVFWGQPQDSSIKQKAISLRDHWKYLIPLTMALGLALSMVIWVGDIYEVSNRAASQILNPEQYIEAVNLAEFE
jgi:multicomponent Na+:H+ antiporter subunit D